MFFHFSIPGDAQAILAKAEAKSKAICILSEALSQQVSGGSSFPSRPLGAVRGFHLRWLSVLVQNGNAAASLSVAEQYVSAFSNLAKESNTVLLPTSTGDVSGMVTQVRHGRRQPGTTQSKQLCDTPVEERCFGEMRLDTFCHSCIQAMTIYSTLAKARPATAATVELEEERARESEELEKPQ